MIKTVIIEDEPLALTLVQNFVNKDQRLELKGTFLDPIKGLDFISDHNIDLVLLDINMARLNGLEIASHIKNKVKIIFTTAHPEYALDGFKFNAIDYLLKPFDITEFQKAVTKAQTQIEGEKTLSKDEQIIQVKSEHQQIRIKLTEILFIENMKNHVIFRLENKNKIMALMSLKSLEEILPEQFFKVHRSFIINSDKITSTSPKEIFINEFKVPISEANRKWFKQWMGNRSIN